MRDVLEYMRVRAYYDYADITLGFLRRFAQERQQGLRENKRADMAVVMV